MLFRSAARMLNEAKVDGLSLTQAIKAALQQDALLLNIAELQAIQTQLAAFEQLMQSDDAHAIHQATEALNTATEEFAAKRMDASVSRALAGKNLEDLNL